MMILLAAAIASASAEPANFHQTYSLHPLLLPLGRYQLSGEWRTADKVGVMATPQFIRVINYEPSDSEDSLDMLGGTCMVQGRYYLFGTFSRGWFVGGTGGGDPVAHGQTRRGLVEAVEVEGRACDLQRPRSRGVARAEAEGPAAGDGRRAGIGVVAAERECAGADLGE